MASVRLSCLPGAVWRPRLGALSPSAIHTITMALPYMSSLLTFTKPKTSFLDSLPRVSFFSIGTQKEDPREYAPELTQKVTSPVLSLKQRLPPRSWDSHMHVVEPQRYPVAPNAVYQPSSHTLSEAMALEASLGIENIVLVQPSIYGTDNSCLLEALRKVGLSRGRGIVVIDPATTNLQTLTEWHALGVRGVRVNLKSVGKEMNEHELAHTLLEHADLVRPLGWIIQLWVPLHMMPTIERIVPQLGVKVCIDHFGGPELPTSVLGSGSGPEDLFTFDPYTLPGFASLVSLLRAGKTYVKISAPYRLSKDKSMRDIQAIALELLRVAPRRVIYATDWPHTRFDGLNIRPFTESCLQWCSREPGLTERVFRLNTEEMLDGTR